ncbi:hypothetical protein LCGC14_2928960 [marine sediment metagenome]|uniref:Uncharacterized protein n=1 Tax=marine sediment metagenome TaxID=412755 RepID=A0A0F9ACM9_9ZZZZ
MTTRDQLIAEAAKTMAADLATALDVDLVTAVEAIRRVIDTAPWDIANSVTPLPMEPPA